MGMQLKYFTFIKMIEDESLPAGQLRIFSKKTDKDITEDFN
jgi:hypothetical protein